MFRLSLAFGIPVSELFERLTTDEFEWYMAFASIEPFGAIHDERRMAMTALASLAPYSKKELGLADMSSFLDDCADVGTDAPTQERARVQKAEAVMRAFTAMPGWTQVEPNVEEKE